MVHIIAKEACMSFNKQDIAEIFSLEKYFQGCFKADEILN